MRVLLVDDNALQATTREAILRRSGIAVVVAAGAEAALAILNDPSESAAVCLLVTDHLMPGMNGSELARQVRTAYPGLPILVLSGMPDAESEYAGLDVVFQLKPCPPPEFIRLVQSLHSHPARRTA
jgi:CheY-like chemotaxis protein